MSAEDEAGTTSMFLSERSLNDSRTTIFMYFTPAGIPTGSVGLRDSSVFNRTGWPDDRLTGMRLVFVHQNTSQESFFEEMSFKIWIMSLKV
jgi:hypothetical protein